MPQPLSPPASARCLLSFDFDGTLHHPADHPPVPDEFFESIRALRAEHGALWCINTGRSLQHLIEGMIESRFPFLPDWVVAREREIYQPNAFGRMLPHGQWNDRGEHEMHRLFERAEDFLHSIRREIHEHTGAEWIAIDGEPAGIISRTDEEMDWICERIIELVPPRDLGWQRNTIYLRFGHVGYQKGSSLSEIARLLGLTAADCFAIGDGHNDLEMLDPTSAAFIACPANAVSDVREKVKMHQGYVASQKHGHGVVEALRAYAEWR